MKRILSAVLSVLMLFSALSAPSVIGADAEPSASGTGFTNLSDTGITPGPNSGHGNHQTRTVHTSHGDYAAYITDSYSASKGTVDVWSLFRTDTETGTSEVIFTGEKYYDSSQVSLLVDKDENVWAITATSDSRRNLSSEGLDCRAHRLDAKTGEITSYSSLVSGGAQDGYGYGTSYYDSVNERIIVVLAGGDYKAGSNTGASFNWTYFDIKTGKWSRSARHAYIPSRHCYMFGYVDENGGLILIAQRDIKATSLGYPEIGNDNGITSADRDYMWDNYIFRWSANYCWDQLDLYYIPSITRSEIITYNVTEADYSRVIGTQSQRYLFENRLTNYYPETHNNNGGDFLVVKTKDNKTLLHITYNSAYIQAAMYRGKASESIWYHQVWDITDPKAAEKLYSAPITLNGTVADGVQTGGGYSFRLYEDGDGHLYLISCFDPETYRTYYKDGATKTETQYDSSVTVYQIMGKGQNYTYRQTGDSHTLPGGGALINISSHRGGSVKDGTVNVLYMNNDGNGDYIFTSVAVSGEDYVIGDIDGSGSINAIDSQYLVRHLSGKGQEIDLFFADINCDGAVNSMDANFIKRILAGQVQS